MPALPSGGESSGGAWANATRWWRGYYAAQSVTALAQKLGVHMPICECVYDILFNGKDPAAALTELMLRDKRSEF